MSYFSDDKLVANSLPSPTLLSHTMPECKPPKKEPLDKSAEGMLKKALEFAKQGMKDYNDYADYEDGYIEGKYYAYDEMVDHLEMLIKETKE